jgi:hypothetical protein
LIAAANGNQAEPIPADIEHDIVVDGIGVLEHASNLGEIVPPHTLDNPHPRADERQQNGNVDQAVSGCHMISSLLNGRI